MAHDLAYYLKKAALRLRLADFGRASKVGDRQFDERYWQVKGRWTYRGRTTESEVLEPKTGIPNWKAVEKIYEHPTKWRFDCSEFLQVCSFLAHLTLLKRKHGISSGRRKFNDSTASKLEIRPFQGAPFTTRKHYYWRERRADWMKLYPNGKGPAQATCMTVREILDAAPAGTRVLWKNSAGSGAWRNENAMKVGSDRYIANLNYPTLQRLAIRTQGGLTEEQIVTELFRNVPGKESAEYIEAKSNVWVKEISYFSTVPTPLTACGAA